MAEQRSTATARPIEASRKAVISGAAADLDARDPAFIRSQLPFMWLMATLYHRADVRGFDRVPDDRPVTTSPAGRSDGSWSSSWRGSSVAT
jgi:hypothetical protein